MVFLEKMGKWKRKNVQNNFFNEYLVAQALELSIPSNGIIPKAALNLWVKVISICYVGNGKGYRQGIDESAASLSGNGPCRQRGRSIISGILSS